MKKNAELVAILESQGFVYPGRKKTKIVDIEGEKVGAGCSAQPDVMIDFVEDPAPIVVSEDQRVEVQKTLEMEKEYTQAYRQAIKVSLQLCSCI